jgi:hypothetical protein
MADHDFVQLSAASMRYKVLVVFVTSVSFSYHCVYGAQADTYHSDSSIWGAVPRGESH